jgi:DNA-binding response OmpR family regulator
MSADFREAPGVAAAAAEGAQPSVARSRAGGRAGQDLHRNPARRDLQRHGNDVIVVAVPDGPGSLIARLVASLREAGAEVSAPRADGSLLCFAGWTLDPLERRLVAPGGDATYLPRTEFALLQAFLDHPRCVLTRAGLAARTMRCGRVFGSSRTIDSYVSRLRRRLTRGTDASLISTVWGAGYVLDADVVAQRDTDDA